MPRAIGRPPKTEDDGLPHPAEDLSADDDLLSWILIDQLGAMPNTKLGVHPQQVKFVGPSFKTEETMVIVHETVTKGNIIEAMRRLQEFHLIKAHLEGKRTEGQRERMIQHLRRYLLPLMPTSRVEIHTTDRYSFETGHPELAVYATRPLLPGTVMQELQGSVVPLPDQWRQEMEIGEGFAREAAGEESDSDGGSSSDEDEEDQDDEGASDGADGDADGERGSRARAGGAGGDDDEVSGSVPNSRNGREKGKGKERDKDKDGERKARRSDRTKRRDFSIVWSGLKRCFQLFLGPARFLNHDCSPNVELLRQGKYVTFRVIRPIKIGEELTTFYGDNYFGKNNIECLCLTCENNSRGGFTPKEPSRSNSQSRSRAGSTPTPSAHGSARMSLDRHAHTPAGKGSRPPSSLRNSVRRDDVEAGPSRLRGVSPNHSVQSGSVADSAIESAKAATADTDSAHAMEVDDAIAPVSIMGDEDVYMVESGSDSDTSVEEAPRRERLIRQAVKNAKPIILKRQRKKQVVEEESLVVEDEDLPDDFPRCGTCAKPLMERIWYLGRYFDHCARCTRHALIFGLPWPAKQLKDVQEYPPSHMIPNGYIPRKISRVPLPSLSKVVKRREDESTVVDDLPRSSEPITREVRAGIRLRAEIVAEEFMVQSLREAAWTAQDAREQAIVAAAEAKAEALRRREEAKIRRAEEKAKRNANKIRGSGVWSRYEYITVEEAERREAARNAITSGTRRGGRYRAVSSDSEGANVRAVEAATTAAPPPAEQAQAQAQIQTIAQPPPRPKGKRKGPPRDIERPKRGRGRPRKIIRPGRPKKIRDDADGQTPGPSAGTFVGPKRPRGRPRKYPLPTVQPNGQAKPTPSKPSESASPEKNHEDYGESEQTDGDDYNDDYDGEHSSSSARSKRAKRDDHDGDDSADDSDGFEPSSDDEGSIQPGPSRISPRKRPSVLPAGGSLAPEPVAVPESTLQRVGAYIRACGMQLGRTRAWFVPIPGKDDIAVDIEKTGAFRDVYEQLGRVIPDKNPNTGKPWDQTPGPASHASASRSGEKDMAPLKTSGSRSNVRLSPPPQTVNSTAHTSSALPSKNTSRGRTSVPGGDAARNTLSSSLKHAPSTGENADQRRRSLPAVEHSQVDEFESARIEPVDLSAGVDGPPHPRDAECQSRSTVSPEKAAGPPAVSRGPGFSKYADLPRFEKRKAPTPAPAPAPTGPKMPQSAAEVLPPAPPTDVPARPRFPLPAKPNVEAIAPQPVTFPERPPSLRDSAQPGLGPPPRPAAAPVPRLPSSSERPPPLPTPSQHETRPRPTAAPSSRPAGLPERPPVPQPLGQSETRAPAAIGQPSHPVPPKPRLSASNAPDLRSWPHYPRFDKTSEQPLLLPQGSQQTALPPRPLAHVPTPSDPRGQGRPDAAAPSTGKDSPLMRQIASTVAQTRAEQQRLIAERQEASRLEKEREAARLVIEGLRAEGKFDAAEAMRREYNLDAERPSTSREASSASATDVGRTGSAGASEHARPVASVGPKTAMPATSTQSPFEPPRAGDRSVAHTAGPSTEPASRAIAAAASAQLATCRGPEPDLPTEVSQALDIVLGPYRQEDARRGRIGQVHARAMYAWCAESSMSGQAPWAVVPQGSSVVREVRYPSTTPLNQRPSLDPSPSTASAASPGPAQAPYASLPGERRTDTSDRRLSAHFEDSSRASPPSALGLDPLPTFPPAPIPGLGGRDPSAAGPRHDSSTRPRQAHDRNVDEHMRRTDTPPARHVYHRAADAPAALPPLRTNATAASSRAPVARTKSTSPTKPSDRASPPSTGQHGHLTQMPVLREMSPRSWREKLRVRPDPSPESPPPHKRPRKSRTGQNEPARPATGAEQPRLQVQIHEPPPAWLDTPSTATGPPVPPPPPPPPAAATASRPVPEVIEIIDDDVSDTDSIIWLPPPPGEAVVPRPTQTQPTAAGRSTPSRADPDESDADDDGIQVYEGPLNRPMPSPEHQPFSARRYNIRPTSHWSPSKSLAGQGSGTSRARNTPTAGATPRAGHSRDTWYGARDEETTTGRGAAQVAPSQIPLPASVSPTTSTSTSTSAVIRIAPVSTGFTAGSPVTPRIHNLVTAISPQQGVFPPARGISHS